MALGDSKRAVAYELNKGRGNYNHDADTFSYVIVSDDYASIDMNATSLNLSDVTPIAAGGSYTGKTPLTGRSWAQQTGADANKVRLTFNGIQLAANASNPTTGKCLVVLNDTSTNDDIYAVWDLTSDGTTAPSMVAGLTFNFNANGAARVAVNP